MDSASLWEEWRIVGILTIYHSVNLNSDRKCTGKLGRGKNQHMSEEIGLLEDEWRFEMDLKLLDRGKGGQRAWHNRGPSLHLSITISKTEITWPCPRLHSTPDILFSGWLDSVVCRLSLTSKIHKCWCYSGFCPCFAFILILHSFPGWSHPVMMSKTT